MYPPYEWLKEGYLNDARETRPLVLCEYCHAMGNGPGDLKQYWDIIESDDRSMGGFIWQWKDHGVLYGDGGYQQSQPSVEFTGRRLNFVLASKQNYSLYKYGGDFGEVYHDGNFCVDGLVGPGLEIKPGVLNLKKVYGGVKTKDAKIAIKNFVRTHAADFAVTDKTGKLEIRCGDTAYKVDKASGEVSSVIVRGEEILKQPIKVNIFRAPTDNDRNIISRWQSQGFDDAEPVAREIITDKDSRSVIVRGKMLAPFRASCLDFKLIYKFFDTGLSVRFEYSVPKDLPPRAGIVFALSSSFDKVAYTGRGPYECYADTKDFCGIGRYELRTDELFTDYIKPQENGSRCDATELALQNKGRAVRITADKLFSFSALPHSAQTLFKSSHNWRLPLSDALYISLDSAMRGIGSNSCGPALAAQFEIPKSGDIEFFFEWQ